MPAMELLQLLIKTNLPKFSRQEILLLEANLFSRLYIELKEIFKIQNEGYFRLMKFNSEMEEAMIEDHLARCIIKDILATEDYTLSGIAYYTQTPEDVVYEVAIGQNTNPTAKFLRKIIELHREVKPNLYEEIMKKITTPQEGELS